MKRIVLYNAKNLFANGLFNYSLSAIIGLA